MLIRIGIWSLVDKVSLSAANILSPLVLSLFYDPSKFGIYIFNYTLALLISMTAVFVDDKVVKNLYAKNNNESYIVSAGQLKIAILSLVALLFIFLSYNNIVIVKNLKLILLFLVHFFIYYLGYKYTLRMEYHLNTKNLAVCNIISAFFLILLQSIIGLLQFHIIYCAYALIFSTIVRYALLRILNPLPFVQVTNFNARISFFKSILSKSFAFGLAAAASLIYMRVDILMIEHFLSLSEVGIYSIAVQMVTISTILIVPIQTIFFPKIRRRFENSKSSYYELFIFITSFSWVAFILLSIMVFFSFRLLFQNFNPDYIVSLNIFMILSLSGFFISLSILRSLHLTLSKSGKFLLCIQFLALLNNVYLNTVLIPVYGLYGGAAATVLSQFASLFASNLFFSKHRVISILQLKSLNFVCLKNYHRFLN